MSTKRIVFDENGLTVFYDENDNLNIRTFIDSKTYTPKQQMNIRFTITNIENNRIHISAFFALLILCLIGSWFISFKLLPPILLTIPIIPMLTNIALGLCTFFFLLQSIKCSFFLVIDYKDNDVVKMETLRYGTINTMVNFAAFIHEFIETMKKEAKDISIVKFP